MIPTSRKEAKELGKTRYFTGIPCKHGHVCERKVHNAGCVECFKIYSKEYKSKFTRKGTQTNRHYLLWSDGKKLLTYAKNRARKNGIEFSITEDDFEIPTHCPILGIKLERYTDYAPSLDRRDNSLGYVKGNVFVISQRANRMKGDLDIPILLRLLEYLGYPVVHQETLKKCPVRACIES